METRRILIVDDDETLRLGLRTYLEFEGYEVTTADSAEQAIELNPRNYDLILLDIMMDGMSGTDFAAKLRNNPSTASIPIIFLTARDTVDDMVDGLRLGADDYIAKPYAVKNVIARIEAVLRRTSSAAAETTPSISGVFVDRNSLTVKVDGRDVKLPRKEFELLALLTENPGRVFSRAELMSRVWPDNTIVADRSVDVHITKLRNNIAPYGRNIITRSGYGYGWQN